jgi:hypothetical protein
MIRKLSVASITSSFTKRSGSLASMTKIAIEDEKAESHDSVRPVSRGQKETVRHVASNLIYELEFEAKEDGMQMIRDEGTRKSSTSTSGTSPSVFEQIEVTGTVRRIQVLKLDTDDPDSPPPTPIDEAGVVGTPALRTSSANSLPRLSRGTSSSKQSPCSSEKENMCQPPLTKPLRRNSRRWGRVVNRDIMVQGIRSFFR